MPAEIKIHTRRETRAERQADAAQLSKVLGDIEAMTCFPVRRFLKWVYPICSAEGSSPVGLSLHKRVGKDKTDLHAGMGKRVFISLGVARGGAELIVSGEASTVFVTIPFEMIKELEG